MKIEEGEKRKERLDVYSQNKRHRFMGAVF